MSLSYWLLLIAAQTIWACSYTAMKIGLEYLPYSLVIFIRYGLVAGIFTVYWCFRGFPKVSKKLLWISAIVGFCNFYGSQFFQLQGLRYTQAIDVSILILFEPMLTVLMAFFILHERISKNLWIVLGIAMVGFFLISDIRLGTQSDAWSSLRLFGNMLFLFALVFEAICSVFGKVITKELHAIDAMGMLMSFGGIGAFVIHAPLILQYDYTSIPLRAWGALLFLTLGCSVFAYTAWYYAISKVRVQYVALSLFLQPIVGSLVGFLILDEKLTIKTLSGAIIISGGLLWWQTRRKAMLHEAEPRT
ncbi:MAG: DMT family transporter [Bdellovibrionales bacterium]|nr:DMT family transporter [Bdellovibrionales bacterium]